MVGDEQAAGDGDIGEAFEREMGFSHVEFRRALQRTYADAGIAMREDGADIPVGEGSLRIRMGPEGERRIALLKLPVTRIYFKFDNVSGAERTAFMQRFELYFRRGGG